MKKITVTAHPITDPQHIVKETFKDTLAARKWCNLLKQNGWKVTGISSLSSAS